MGIGIKGWIVLTVETPENSDVEEDEVDDISLLLPGSISLVQLLQGNRHVCVLPLNPFNISYTDVPNFLGYI